MAIPVIAIAANAAVRLLQHWKGVAALVGLIVATGFTFSGMLWSAGHTARKLWPLLALLALVILVKEFMKNYFYARREKLNQDEK